MKEVNTKEILDLTALDLLNYSIDFKLKHIPSALSQFSYLRYVLPLLPKNIKIILGKQFGSQAYYLIWKKMGLIKKNIKLSYFINHKELPFIHYTEETLGNSLGVAAGVALTESDKSKLVYVNISDSILQMGATQEAIQFIGKHQLNIFITMDFNNYQLTGKIDNISQFNIDKTKSLFELYNIKAFVIDIQDNNIKQDIINGIEYQIKSKKPTIILFKTIKGFGVKEMEEDPIGWHYKALNNINEITINEKK